MSTAIWTGLLAGALTFGLAGAAQAETQEGSSSVTLDKIFAVEQTGSPAPAFDSFCRDAFGDRLGSEVTTDWQINPQTLIMIAQSELFGASVLLHPLGISGSYVFMSDGVPDSLAEIGVDRVIFHLSEDFDDPESDVLFDLDAAFNCLLSNKDMG